LIVKPVAPPVEKKEEPSEAGHSGEASCLTILDFPPNSWLIWNWNGFLSLCLYVCVACEEEEQGCAEQGQEISERW